MKTNRRLKRFGVRMLGVGLIAFAIVGIVVDGVGAAPVAFGAVIGIGGCLAYYGEIP